MTYDRTVSALDAHERLLARAVAGAQLLVESSYAALLDAEDDVHAHLDAFPLTQLGRLRLATAYQFAALRTDRAIDLLRDARAALSSLRDRRRAFVRAYLPEAA